MDQPAQSPVVTTELPATAGIEVGDYLCSDTDLYRVEELKGDRVLIEDCRTDELIDIPRSRLDALDRVRMDKGSSEAPSDGD